MIPEQDGLSISGASKGAQNIILSFDDDKDGTMSVEEFTQFF